MKPKFLIQFILLFIACLFSTTAIASEHLYTDSNGLTWRFELENGEATLISDNDEDGTYEICVTGDHIPATLIVPSRVKVGNVEYPVVAIGWDAFAYGWLSSTSIVLPESVTRIENNAFYHATNLKSIHIPTSVTTIESGAFEECNNLEIAEFGSIESLCNIEFGVYGGHGMGMYTYTANPLTYAHHLYIDGEEITNVVIPRSITTIKRGVFWGCNNITSVFIPATVTSIDHWAFASGPRTFIVNWQTPISIPSDAFQYEYGGGIPDGSTLYIPHGTRTAYEASEYWKDFNTFEMEELSNISFADANVKALCVDNWDTNGDGELSEAEAAAVTSLGEVFKENTDITSFDELQYFTGLTSINSRAFDGCSGLTSVIIPNSVASIDADAFCWCSHLTSVTIPNGVTTIAGDAFAMCPAMTTISIPEGVTSIGDCAFSSTGLTSITIPSSVTDIGIDVFYNCRDLTSITVDTENNAYDSRENCNAIIETATNTLVTGCKNSFIPSDVINIGYSAFDGCSGLTSIDIPTNVTSIGQEALYGCSGLTSITIPNSVISIGSIAFKRCSGLTSVISEIEDPYAFGSGAFDEISSTCTLTVPAGTRDAYIAAGWTEEVFKGGVLEASAPVQNITFADANVKALCVYNWDTNEDGELSEAEAAAVTDLAEVFRGNTTITSFDELQYFTGLESIGENAFKECSNLTSATLPDGLLTIESGAFQKSGLTSIQFPTTLTSVGSCAFAECASLADIDFTGCQAAFYEGCFQRCSALEELYVPNTVKFRGYNTFWGCSSLQTAIFEAFEEGQEKWSVEHLFSADYTTSSLETVVLPATSVITKGGLKNCSNLQTVTFLEDDAPVNNSRHFIKNFTGVPDDVLFVIPEGTAENFLKRGYKNLSDKSGLPLVRAEFEAEAARIVTMANALTDGNKTALTSAITEARTTVNATDDYMTIYAQIAAIKNAAKTYLGTADMPENLDVTAAYINNPDFDRFDIGWSMSNYAADCGYYTGDNYQYTNGEVSIDHFVESWSGEALEDGSISQTITNLPIGRYRLECDAIATWKADASVEVTGVNLFAGTKKTPLATENEKPQHFTLDFTQYRTGDCTIGIDINNTTANWVAMDNVRLYRVSDITSPVDENTAYYLQNVETGKYLNQGNDWGTHAVLADEGLPVKVVKRAAGSYTVEFLEGSDHDHLLFRFDRSNDVYVDYNSEDESQNPYWVISDAETEGTYYIQSILNAETMYLGNNPTKEAYDFYGNALGVYNDVDANILNQEGMNITWRFVKVDNEKDYLTVDDTEGFVGGKVTLNVGMTNTESIKGVQFDLRLPAGVMVATDANDEMMISLTDRAHSSHQVSPRLLSNGDYRIVITSMSAKTFSGTEGDIMNITLNVAGNVDEGDYEVKVSSVELNTKQNVRIQPTDVTATLTLNIRDVILGDANGDGDVTVTDVGMVIDDILENTPANFVKAAADVNEDGDVTVTDVGLIIDIILSDGAATRRFDEEDESEVLDPQ